MGAGNTAGGGGTASFEVDRLEWVAPDRLEVAGRWFGVRGLRFVRPSLDLEVGDERRHLLAVLDHKPWEAHDGEEWVAAFPWHGEKVQLDFAELAVTPGVVVELPVPGASGKRRSTRREEPKKPARPKQPAAAGRARDDRARAEAEALRQERDAALAARDQARQERDAALAARDAIKREHDQLTQERDAALAERDAAVADAEATAAAHGATLAELTPMTAQRDAALRERDAAQRALEERSAQLDKTTRALKAAREAGSRAKVERDEAVRARDAALAERDDLARKRGPTQPTAELSAAPPLGANDEPQSPWRMRLAALGALVLLLAIAAAVLQGVL